MKKVLDGFTAKEVNFQGDAGYMLCQYRNGVKVMEQFISGEYYEQFCKTCGIEPELIV